MEEVDGMENSELNLLTQKSVWIILRENLISGRWLIFVYAFIQFFQAWFFNIGVSVKCPVW